MSLPLFPLNTVLFPGCILDLQIFEARYLDMIGRLSSPEIGLHLFQSQNARCTASGVLYFRDR